MVYVQYDLLEQSTRRTAILDALPNDVWLAKDKVEHFCSCAAVTLFVYVGCLYLNRLARYRFVLSGGCSVIVGVLKEVGDYLQVDLIRSYVVVETCVLSFPTAKSKSMTSAVVAWAIEFARFGC